MKDTGRSKSAKAALAGAHTKTNIAADIIQGLSLSMSDSVFNIGSGDKFTFTNQLAISFFEFNVGEPITEMMMPVGRRRTAGCGLRSVAGGWEFFEMGSTSALGTQFLANLIDRNFGHFSVGGPFSTGDSKQARDAIAIFVVKKDK